MNKTDRGLRYNKKYNNSLGRTVKSLIVLTLLTFMFAGKGYSQQYFINGFYMFNPLAFNPGIVGADDRISASAIYRNQWTGINGAPRTMYANIHAPFSALSVTGARSLEDYPTGLSAGLTLTSDILGATENTSIGIPIGAKIRLDKSGGRLSLGIRPDIVTFNTNFDELRQEEGDPIGEGSLSETNIDFAAGLYLYYDTWYLGASATNIRALTMQSEFGVTLERHYFFSGGYVHKVNPNLMLRLTTLATIVKDAPFSITVTPAVIINNNIQTGLAYRSNDMIGANFSFNLIKGQDVRLGYQYEYPLGDKLNEIGNTHEFVLSYSFVRYRKQVISPRYFW